MHPGIGTLATRPLATRQRAPNIVVAHSHRYRPTQAARALVECATGLVRGLSLTCQRA
jgi:hypothetical protein